MSSERILVESLAKEVFKYVSELQADIEGEHLYSNYQKVTAYILRLQEIHNEISLMEISGEAGPELKKFRTTIVDPTIERFEKVAAFESRKITAKQIELNLER